ncbi:MAG: transcription antitermination factor NusB [Pseudoprimorskyibacter sp.]|nr:transcription antitermination factor NusB [Pseudoprimorskyibacter sp.]
MSQQPNARSAALALISSVTGEGQMISDLAPDLLGPLSPPERAAAQRLALGVLRQLGPIDRLLALHLDKVPPSATRNILRLATYELTSGGAAHGVVHSAVTATGARRKTRHLKGLVNAVLRRIAEAGSEALDDKATRMPKWLRHRSNRAWGAQATAAIECAHAVQPPIDLTAKVDPQALADAVGGMVLPTGSVRIASGQQVSALPGYDTGEFWVQDAAAALPVRMLGDIAGARALDICAAPGGKTMQLAAAGAHVLAVDSAAKRMARLTENLQRTLLTAETRVADAHTVTGQFDVILLDAPCSATGTIRRHPDLPHVGRDKALRDLVDLQRRLLDHALTLLAPNGRLMYCTCSLLPDEGEHQIRDALQRHDIELVDTSPPGTEPSWLAKGGGLRIRPDFWSDLGGLDGFFMAAMRQRS